MKIVFYILTILLLFSCRKESKQVNEINSTEDTITEITPGIAPDTTSVTISNPDTFEGIVLHFKQLSQSTVRKLKNAAAEEGNDIYESYYASSEKILENLNEKDRKLLDDYYTYFIKDGVEVNPTDSMVIKKMRILKDAGLEYRHAGEGMGYITTRPDYYLTLFKAHVTKDYKDFLAIMAEQDKVALSYDAGLNISFEAVGKRTLAWENYLNKHRGSTLMPKAKELYKDYQDFFIFGLDNTPSMEYPDTTLFPENKKILLKFIADNPKSFTSVIAKKVIDSPGQNYDNLIKVINKMQSDYLLKF